MSIETVKTDELRQDSSHGNTWSSADDGKVAKLEADMRCNGFDDSNPIIVLGNTVIDGRHRVLAARRANIDEIPALHINREQAERAWNGNFNKVIQEIEVEAGILSEECSGFGSVPKAVMQYDQ